MVAQKWVKTMLLNNLAETTPRGEGREPQMGSLHTTVLYYTHGTSKYNAVEQESREDPSGI